MSDQTITVRPPVWALLVAVAVGGAFYLSGKYLEVQHRNDLPSTIVVSGEGRAFAAPDIAEISVGFASGRQQTAAIAMEKLKNSTDKIIAAIKKAGVEERDIRTENFYLNPVYDWTSGVQQLRGFEANQSLRVKVRDMDKVSDVLGAATAAGANQAGSVSFTVDNPDAKRAEARAEAITEAKEKAKVLADQLGVRLGRIVNFTEGTGASPMPPIYYGRDAVGMGGGGESQAVDLPAGEQEMRVSVSITYELE